MQRPCGQCGTKFDIFWWGSETRCRKCFAKERTISKPRADAPTRGQVGLDVSGQATSAAHTTSVPRRSFEAANGLFDLLTFISWAIIAVGGLAAFFLFAQTNSPFSLVIAASGAISGFLMLAAVQIGRAVVHTAVTTDAVYRLLESRLAQIEVEPEGASSSKLDLDDLGI